MTGLEEDDDDDDDNPVAEADEPEVDDPDGTACMLCVGPGVVNEQISYIMAVMGTCAGMVSNEVLIQNMCRSWNDCVQLQSRCLPGHKPRRLTPNMVRRHFSEHVVHEVIELSSMYRQYQQVTEQLLGMAFFRDQNGQVLPHPKILATWDRLQMSQLKISERLSKARADFTGGHTVVGVLHTGALTPEAVISRRARVTQPTRFGTFYKRPNAERKM